MTRRPLFGSDRLAPAHILAAACLLTALLLCYWPVQHFDFISFDDPDYVAENRMVQQGLSLSGVVWAFTTFHAANWHPVTWLSHMLDAALFGMNPGAFHWVNVWLHLANTLLVLGVLFRMTGAFWRSFAVAALFGLHPLHVESVAWISERKDLLAAFFGLLALGAYESYATRKRRLGYLFSGVFFILSLTAKPMLVTLPFLLLLLDAWPLGRWGRDLSGPGADKGAVLPLLVEKIPFFVLSVASCVVTVAAQHYGGAVRALDAYPLWIRIGNAAVSYVRYLGKALWPSDLALYYPHPGRDLSVAAVLGSLAVLAAVSTLVLRAGKSRLYLPVGWLWYLGSLVPVIGVVQVGSQAMADRYTYIPLIGCFVMASWGLWDAGRKFTFWRPLLAGVLAAALAGFAVASMLQVQQWENGIRLYRSAIERTGANAKMYNSLGAEYAKRNDWRRAELLFSKALAARPNFALAHNNMAAALERAGRREEAERHYRRALAIDPQMAAAHFGLGLLLARRNRTEEAFRHLAEAIRIDPDHAKAHHVLGVLFRETGNPTAARRFISRALEIDPGFVKARKDLRQLDRTGNGERAGAGADRPFTGAP